MHDENQQTLMLFITIIKYCHDYIFKSTASTLLQTDLQIDVKAQPVAVFMRTTNIFRSVSISFGSFKLATAYGL